MGICGFKASLVHTVSSKTARSWTCSAVHFSLETPIFVIKNDFQKLLGDLNWVRPSLGIPTGVLKPLFDILQENPDPTSFRKLTPQTRQCITLIEEKLASAHIHYSQPLLLVIFPSQHSATGVFWQ